MTDHKNTKMRCVAAASAVATLIPSAWVLNASSASADDPLAPIALSGSVAGVDELLNGSVKVEVLPDQELVESFGDDAVSVHNSEVPASMVSTSGNTYQVRIDPLALPAEDISYGGIVTFQVYAQDPNSGQYSGSIASVRAVLQPDGTYAWTDPLGPADGMSDDEVAGRMSAAALARYRTDSGGRSPLVSKYTRSVRPVRANLPKPATKGIICNSAGCAPSKFARSFPHLSLSVVDTGDDETDARGTAIDAPIISEGSTQLSDCPPGGAGTVYTGQKRAVSSTIGSSYPIGIDTSWMDYTSGSSDEYTGRFGIAVFGGAGGWQQTDTKAVEQGSGFTWDAKTYMRSYRVDVTYEKIKQYFDRCPPQDPYQILEMPEHYSGGVGENSDGMARPDDWNQCATVNSTGTWWRKRNDGSSYSLSYGVKFFSVLGIDLSSRRAYNDEAMLAYHINVVGRRMCAKTNDPGVAAKVMEKSRA